jgi:hypothetical protein
MRFLARVVGIPLVGVFQLGPATNTPFGMAFDGANIWVGYGQGSHLPASGVYKL